MSVTMMLARRGRKPRLAAEDPPIEGIPAPQEGHIVLVNTLDGQAHSIQSAASFEAALALLDPYGPGTDTNGSWGWATDIDGAGTRAFRLQHTAVGSSYGDQGGLIGSRLWASHATPAVNTPKSLYIQFKHRMGKAPSDSGGTGTNNTFQITNGDDPVGNAGRKFLLLGREYGENYGRLDHTWSGPAPAGATTSGWEFGDGTGGTYGPPDPGSLGSNIVAPNLEALIGQEYTFTLYFQAESASNAGDGVVSWWHNDQLQGHHTGKRVGPWGVAGYSVPTVFRSPAITQCEYFWNFRVWTPQAPD